MAPTSSSYDLPVTEQETQARIMELQNHLKEMKRQESASSSSSKQQNVAASSSSRGRDTTQRPSRKTGRSKSRGRRGVSKSRKAATATSSSKKLAKPESSSSALSIDTESASSSKKKQRAKSRGRAASTKEETHHQAPEKEKSSRTGLRRMFRSRSRPRMKRKDSKESTSSSLSKNVQAVEKPKSTKTTVDKAPPTHKDVSKAIDMFKNNNNTKPEAKVPAQEIQVDVRSIYMPPAPPDLSAFGDIPEPSPECSRKIPDSPPIFINKPFETNSKKVVIHSPESMVNVSSHSAPCSTKTFPSDHGCSTRNMASSSSSSSQEASIMHSSEHIPHSGKATITRRLPPKHVGASTSARDNPVLSSRESVRRLSSGDSSRVQDMISKLGGNRTLGSQSMHTEKTRPNALHSWQTSASAHGAAPKQRNKAAPVKPSKIAQKWSQLEQESKGASRPSSASRNPASAPSLRMEIKQHANSRSSHGAPPKKDVPSLSAGSTHSSSSTGSSSVSSASSGLKSVLKNGKPKSSKAMDVSSSHHSTSTSAPVKSRARPTPPASRPAPRATKASSTGSSLSGSANQNKAPNVGRPAPMRANLLKQIEKKDVKLKKVSPGSGTKRPALPSASSTLSGGPPSIMDGIKAGVALKQVGYRKTAPAPPPAAGGGHASALLAKLQERKKQIIRQTGGREEDW